MTCGRCARAALVGGIVAGGALALGASPAGAVPTPVEASCSGVSITFEDAPGTATVESGTFFVFPATVANPNEVWLDVVNADGSITSSAVQSFTTVGDTLTFPWTPGGIVRYYFGWRDSHGLSGYVVGAPGSPTGNLGTYLAPGPSQYLSFDSSSCAVPAAVVTTTIAPTPTTSAPAPLTTTAPSPVPLTVIPPPRRHHHDKLVAPVPVPLATVPHTGEPWAGTGWLVDLVASLGAVMIGGGLLKRRNSIVYVDPIS